MPCQATGNVIVSPNLVTANAGGCTVSTVVYAVDSYVVACTAKVAPSVSFRTVRCEAINVSDTALLSGASSPYHIVGDLNEGCEPRGLEMSNATILSLAPTSVINITWLLTDTALATAAGAWPLLTEERDSDGSPETLFDAFIWQYGDSIFKNPRNPIEDILGLASGIALGLSGVGHTMQISISKSGVVEFTGVSWTGQVVGNFLHSAMPLSATVLTLLIWRTRHILSLPWKIWNIFRHIYSV